MKPITIRQAQELLAPHGIVIRRFRSKKKFIGSNWLVRVRTSQPKQMSDGTLWDGWENVGRYCYANDAIKEAIETAKNRNCGEL
jgi:hypothetical protein